MKLVKILLIDDDEEANFLHRAVLRHAKIAEKVTTYTSGKEALEKLQGTELAEDLPDLIFLDLNMPTMNGWQFLDAVEKIHWTRGIPNICMLTSSIDRKDEEKARSYSCVKYFVSKPLSIDKAKELHAKLFTGVN